LLSEKTEAADIVKENDDEVEEVLLSDRRGNDSIDEERPIPIIKTTPIPTPSSSLTRFAQISPATRAVMFKLWPLLIVDSLADGMVGYSLTTYYMDRRFHISASALGDITSVSYFLSAASTVFSGPLSNRLGLINTMVFTHLPSSAAVLLFPLSPNLALCIILFFIRTGLNNMDQAPRSAFIAAAVKPEERTAVMGITSVLRTLASTAGPSVTGWLAESDQFWIAFVAAGVLRIAYDCGLWALFINMDIGEKAKSRIQG
jgi:MFS family permease